MRKTPLYTKDFLLHCFSYLIMAVSFYLLLPTLPTFVTDVLGENKDKVGYIIGIYALSALLVRPISGYLFDKYGRRKLFLISMLLYAVVMASYGLAASFGFLLFLRLINGGVWGVVTTGGGTITSDIVPEGRRGEGIGIFGLSMTLSMAVGPLIGLQILKESGSYSVLFVTAGVLCLIAVGMSFMVNHPAIGNRQNKLEWANVFEPKVLKVSLVMLFLAFPFAGVMSFITLFAKELSLESTGLFFLIYAAGVSIIRPLTGKMMDKKGPGFVMVLSFAGTISGLVLLSQSEEIYGFLIAAFVLGLGNGIVMPTLQTMVINMVRPHKRGVATSTFFSSIDLGIGIGAFLLGNIAEIFSLSQMYLFCAFITVIPMVLFFGITLKDYKKKIEILTAATNV
ncbi:MFS transporter [Marivirga sp. S37H4]|uniref:MFS transporter n=2 Tax=Marivirga aurantiaca TaxID=2802615 RepID=A0A934X2P2_9BACT|nr:MFS transporter [Marivirga aurantiaca]